MISTKSVVIVAVILFLLKTSIFAHAYTGIIINTQGNTSDPYLAILINDGSKEHVQPNYILDTKVAGIDNANNNAKEIFAIAGKNPLVIDAKINNNEILVSEKISSINRPIIVII